MTETLREQLLLELNREEEAELNALVEPFLEEPPQDLDEKILAYARHATEDLRLAGRLAQELDRGEDGSFGPVLSALDEPAPDRPLPRVTPVEQKSWLEALQQLFFRPATGLAIAGAAAILLIVLVPLNEPAFAPPVETTAQETPIAEPIIAEPTKPAEEDREKNAPTKTAPAKTARLKGRRPATKKNEAKRDEPAKKIAKPKPSPRRTMEKRVTEVKDALSGEEQERQKNEDPSLTIERHRNLFEPCYELKEQIRGKLTFTVKIQASGKVASVAPPEAYTRTRFAACVAQKMKKIRFAPRAHTFFVPFILK